MKRFDLCVARSYEQNGEKKTQWQNCGVVFEKDGKMWGELRLIPTGWDGRFQLFEPKDNQLPFAAAPKAEQKVVDSVPTQNDLPF